MAEAWAYESVKELGARLRRKEMTSVQLTEFFLDRMERFGPEFNAVVTITRDRALEEARDADQEFAEGRDRGPLHGIPYGAKDLLATKGIPTTWGAAPYRDQVFDFDATVIERLTANCAVLIAKLSMIELAGGFGYRQANASFTGPGRNAWDRTRWAGGSSSGPGSAVAAGLCPFAIGSETSGSILTPAGYNGLSGLRPSYGRVSRHGAMTLSWTLDKIGPMCRTAEDCGCVLSAIEGVDPNDASTPIWTATSEKFQLGDRKWKIGTLRNSTNNVESAVRDNFLAAMETFKEAAEISEVELPDLPYGPVVGTIISCEMAAAFEDLIRDRKVWELTAPEDRWGGHSNLAIPAKDYINAQRIRGKIQRALDAVLSEFDALAAPTLSTVAGPVDKDFREWSKGFSSHSMGTAGNAAGAPAITIPNGFGTGGLPTGLHLLSRVGEESRLLALASWYQSKTDWHRKHPEIS